MGSYERCPPQKTGAGPQECWRGRRDPVGWRVVEATEQAVLQGRAIKLSQALHQARRLAEWVRGSTSRRCQQPPPHGAGGVPMCQHPQSEQRARRLRDPMRLQYGLREVLPGCFFFNLSEYAQRHRRGLYLSVYQNAG